MHNILTTFFVLASGCVFAQADISSPDDFLPTDFGKEFTPHHLVVDYFRYIGAQSKHVKYQPYGYSFEKRKLGVAIISSEENIKNLEKIRSNNLRITGLQEGRVDDSLSKVIVWINSGMHGNEAGGVESSMELLYRLASKDDAWLDKVVVIINPCSNPDGYGRYVAWNRSVSHDVLMPNELSREQKELWPTGRTNHFYFDLNRDWAWATQVETQSLLKIYHSWMPHVMADIHEQSPNGNYYFAPAAAPFHEYISVFQKDFQDKIGQANAKTFDQKGWLYFTKEIFDLFYPSYSDTYAMFNGAVGMTYEQAGMGASKSYLRDGGDTLWIQDRIDGQVAALLSTVQTVKENQLHVLRAFRVYFEKSRKKSLSDYEGYVIKKGQDTYKLRKLAQLLDRHQIEYKTVKSVKMAEGFSYEMQDNTSFAYEYGDLIIPAKQTMGVLVNVLFEPSSNLEGSATYDITAWALPYAFGLESYAVKGALPSLIDYTDAKPPVGIVGRGDYAWGVEWTATNSGAFLAELLRENVKVRYASKPFEIEGKSFDRGSLLVSRGENKLIASDLPDILERISKKHQVTIYALGTGWAAQGPDLGAKSMKLVDPPKIAMLVGESVKGCQYGEFWHFLDKELQYPFVALSLKDFEDGDIWDFNTIILVDGFYDFEKTRTQKYLRNWVNKGGKLILVASACQIFNGLQDLKLDMHPPSFTKNEILTYEEKMQEARAMDVPGGIVEVCLDNTHPLGYGYSKHVFSLKKNGLSYDLIAGGNNVGRTPSFPKTIGYFCQQFLSHFGDNLVYGHRKIGKGDIIYFVNDPLFRGYWEDGKLMVANAIFFK